MKNKKELSITLKNGSRITLKGAENPDALRGVKLKGLVIEDLEVEQAITTIIEDLEVEHQIELERTVREERQRVIDEVVGKIPKLVHKLNEDRITVGINAVTNEEIREWLEVKSNKE